MNPASIRNAILTSSVVLLLIFSFIPSSRPFFPYLAVLVFVGLTIKLTWDGITTKRMLESQVNDLEQRLKYEIKDFYDKNPHKHEQINRLTLIDNKCSKNDRFNNWENGKRYYQSLPNFLLSIGLCGTFLGITLNLLLIGINTRGEVNLNEILPNIISSMAIAFCSSLVALACSIFLTKFHPSSQLEIAKDNLLISLEHYIDTEYLLKSTTKIDRLTSKIDNLIESIDNYSQTLTTFLSSLEQNTRKFKDGITDATNKINISANNFQTIVNQSSQTMQTGANVLTNATNSIATLTTTFSDITSSLNTSAKSFQQSTSSLQSYGKNLQQVSDTLVKNSLQVEKLSEKNADNLQNLSDTLISNSTQVQNLMQNNQQNLTTVSERLVQNANVISNSTQSFQQNITKMETALNQHSSQVGKHNDNLQQLSGVIANATQSSNANIPQLTTMLGNQVNQLQNVANQFNQNTQIMQQIQNNLSSLLYSFQQSQN